MAEKILVVDDDIDSLKLIGLMLQRQGYDIIAANAGAPALVKANTEYPDLIILDVMMPDMDGYEVCKRLRANPATQAIPIIMFTAKTLVDDKVAGFEAGADDYLTKPTHPAELASRVRAVLARSAAQRRTTSDSGMLLGFIGVKGGVGTSTLTANVGAVIGQKEPTILGDIRMGQGTLGLSLGLGRSTGMANLLSRPPAEISARAVENELVLHNSGFKVLLSSVRPRERLVTVNPDVAALIVKHLRSLARNVMLDLGTGLTKTNVRLIKDLDQTVLVVEPTRIALSIARELLKEMETLGVGRARTNVVIVNRAQASLQIPWQEAEQILNHEMVGVVGAASDLAFQAADAGVPMVLFQPSAMFATQIGKLTEEIVGHNRAAPTSAA